MREKPYRLDFLLVSLSQLIHKIVDSIFKDMMNPNHYDLIVIGGGPAGQGAVEFASLTGRRILVIERQVLGGIVVTTGGGPTKTLREAALHLTGFVNQAYMV